MKESEIEQLTVSWGELQTEPSPQTRLCGIDECERKHHAHGFCHTHYFRIRYRTDPGFAERRRKANRAAYRRRVDRRQAS